jgi:integrase
MATIRKRGSGSYEVVIRRGLTKPYYCTLDTEAEAKEYAARIEARIAAGDVPPELLGGAAKAATIGECVVRYRHGARVSAHDQAVLKRLSATVLTFQASLLTVDWALQWVASLQSRSLAPGTIRKKAGALSRCLSWCVMAGVVADNPLRQLPRNYAAYPTEHPAKKEDTERDRRLEPGEEGRIRAVLAHRPEWELLFTMALETAMRMREMFTLSWDQVDIDKRTIFLAKSKNGDKRQVPLSSVILKKLIAIPTQRIGFVFPWWDGNPDTLDKTTGRLSNQWGRIARDAGCPDLRFHDIRHEAVSRLFERTHLSDLQIAKISGHKSLGMLRRYSNLRGSDLANSLW